MAMNRRLIFFSPILSGLLTAAAFLPSAGFLAWVSFVPFFYTVLYKVKTRKDAVVSSFLFSVSFYFPLLSWLFKLHPLANAGIYGARSIILVTLAWVVLSLILALILSAALFFLHSFIKNGAWFAFSAAALFCISEWLQGMGPLAMPWGRLAVSQYMYPAFIQSTSIFGSLFISFIIIGFNAFLALSFKNVRYIGAAIFLLTAIFSLSAIPTGVEFGDGFLAAPVWVNIPPAEKMKAEKVLAAKEQYIEATKEAAKTADFVLWPETAVPVNPQKGAMYINDYKKTAEDYGITLLAGGYYNTDVNYSAVYVMEEGEDIGVYGKKRPVPFGEYTPMRSAVRIFMPSIDEVSPPEEDVMPWGHSSVVSTKYGKIGGMICFDSIFPSLARDAVLDGAEVLCVSTNDSWFYGTQAITQHLAHSVLRAVENGRYLIRSANLGVNCIITPDGKVIDESGEGSLTEEVLPGKGKTLYTVWGDAPILIICFLILGGKYVTKSHKLYKRYCAYIFTGGARCVPEKN